MSIPLEAAAVLDREFLEIRARLLHIAASLDRLDRAEGSLAGDARLEKIKQSLDVLLAADPDRAEKIQLLFSRPYDAQWKSSLLRNQG